MGTVRIDEVEDYLAVRFAATGPAGPKVAGSEVRALLITLGDLEIDCSPSEVVEDALAVEINPMEENPGSPSAFGILMVRRLFLPDPEDGSSSPVEVGFEFTVSEDAGVVYAGPADFWRDLAEAASPTVRDAARNEVVAWFDASPLAGAIGHMTVEPEAFLQDHNEVLG